MAAGEFAEFLSSQRTELLELSWALTLGRGTAKDVAQRTVDQIWQNWDAAKERGSGPATWSRAVAVELARNTPARGPRGRFDDDALAGALAEMGSLARAAASLHYLFDLDAAACAEALGTFPDVAASSLRRADEILKARLGSNGAGPPTNMGVRIRAEAHRQIAGIELVAPSASPGPSGSGGPLTRAGRVAPVWVAIAAALAVAGFLLTR